MENMENEVSSRKKKWLAAPGETQTKKMNCGTKEKYFSYTKNSWKISLSSKYLTLQLSKTHLNKSITLATVWRMVKGRRGGRDRSREAVRKLLSHSGEGWEQLVPGWWNWRETCVRYWIYFEGRANRISWQSMGWRRKRRIQEDSNIFADQLDGWSCHWEGEKPVRCQLGGKIRSQGWAH